MKYGYIDSIRGIAILMVIGVHTSQSIDLQVGVLQYISAYGQMGVQLFFVASAYTLCLSFERRKTEEYRTLKFYVRRFFRVAPIYYVGLIAYLIFRIFIEYLKSDQITIPEQYTISNVLANVFFVHGLYEPANNNIVPGGWSIGTEVLFYLAFPLFMPFFVDMLKSKFIACVLLPVITIVLSGSIITLLGISVTNNGFVYHSILNQSSVFAIGVSLYFLNFYHRSINFGLNNAGIAIFFIFFSSISTYIGWINVVNRAFMLVPFLSGISFAFLIEIFRRTESINHPTLKLIGQRSYSMYIVHFVFAHQFSRFCNDYLLIDLLGNSLALLATFAITVFATYHVAGLSYKFIEIHFLNLGSTLIKKCANTTNQLTGSALAK